MKNVIYIPINGINTLRSDDSWNNQAEIEFARHRVMAHAFQYFSDTVFRRMFQNDRVERLNALCARYVSFGLKVRLMPHSNGGDLCMRLLRQFDTPIDRIYFFAAAADHDCERSGINKAIDEKRLGYCRFFCSRNDEALQDAMISKKLFGWMGLGYDYVGLVGPSNVKHKDRVGFMFRDEMMHSDWFKGENLLWSVKEVIEK